MEEADIEDAVRVSRETIDHEASRFNKGKYPEEAHEFWRDRHTKEKYLKNMQKKDTINLIAEVDGKIIGVSRLAIHEKGGLSHLGWTCIHPSERGNGYGEEMVRYALECCRNHGCHKISLHTFSMLKSAVNLYKKLGFEQEALLMKHYWKMDFILMSKWFEQDEDRGK